MILVVCLPCLLAIRVMPSKAGDAGSARELRSLVGAGSSFWPDKFPCPQCGAFAKGLSEREADVDALAAMTVRDLTPHEAFSAFSGLGFPDEQACSLSSLTQLLTTTAIKRVQGTDVEGQERAVLDFLELVDGTRIYLGAGADGAVVYRITKPVSYTQKILAEGAG